MPLSSTPKAITRNLSPGESLIRPNTRLNSIYLIQSGCISLCHSRDEKMIEITRCFSPDVIGADAVFGPTPWNLIALAVRETTVVEIPVLIIQEQLRLALPAQTSLIKSIVDRGKASLFKLRSLHTNRETPPCPASGTAKLFGVIFHVARILGREEGTTRIVRWDEARQFALEAFEEPAHRLEEGVQLFANLGYARIVTRPLGAELRIEEMAKIEAFFDYYGNYHFKGGYENFLRTDSRSSRVAEAFLKISDEYPVDRAGMAHLPYRQTMDAMRRDLGRTFEADQLFRLEQKGLYLKRVANDEGGTLSFHKPDFVQMLMNWKILREVEKWNEKGFVEPEGPGLQTPVPSAPRLEPGVNPEAERKAWAEALASWKPAISAAGGVIELRTGSPKPGEIWCPICLSPASREATECAVCAAPLGTEAAS